MEPAIQIWTGTVSKEKVVIQIEVSAFSIDKTFQRFSHSPLPVQMQVPFINITIPYKRVISPWFLEIFSSVCYFLKKTTS